MAYEDFKDLTRRTACDTVLLDKALNTAKNKEYVGYQRGLALMFYTFMIETCCYTYKQICYSQRKRN